MVQDFVTYFYRHIRERNLREVTQARAAAAWGGRISRPARPAVEAALCQQHSVQLSVQI